MAIEAASGRRRSEANAARTLDLDIIAIGEMVRAAPDPILPHPRAHLRRFVLAPLADVAPGWVHPLLHETAAALLARLPADGVSVLTVLAARRDREWAGANPIRGLAPAPNPAA